MPEETLNLISAFAALAGVAFGAFAAVRALQDLRRAREQSDRDYRWRQAQAAKQLSDELLAAEPARFALTMLDWERREYTYNGKEYGGFSDADVALALRTQLVHPQELDSKTLVFDENEVFIRDAFDEFLGFLERFEHFISVDLTTLQDLRHPVDYYIAKMAQPKFKPAIQEFLTTYGYHGALSFCDRFPVWHPEQEG
ncbi:hypothetical protein [Marinibacterium sp. SX1]|uniref:hypothetical protein n=1 Tax=Marinibacterium sp. SX1 TaxID=3388424 RepID=UPI003D1738B3